nr:tetratricopeptide repeat protein [Desulfobulbaceae bacterium]
MKKIAILLTILFYVSAPAFAIEFAEISPLEKGKLFFQNKEYEKAYLALHQAFMSDPTDLNVSFFLGRAAFEMGDYENALMAFDRILIMDPNAIRIKLEIARCHMRLNAFQVAKQYFYEVQASNPPKQVRENIEFFLSAIAATEKRHFFTGIFSAGINYDDNVRSAPGDFLLNFSGAAGSISLNVSSEPVNDQIYTNTFAISHIYKFEDKPYSWKTTFTNFNNFYDDYKDLDITYYGISTGPAFQSSNFLFDLHASINNLTLGFDEYVQPSNVGASLTYVHGPQFMLSSSFVLEKKKYSKPSDNSKNATNINFSLSPSYTIGDNRFTFTLMKENENAHLGHWSYDRHKWALRYDRILPKNFTLFASYEDKTTKYGAVKSGDTEGRSDVIDATAIGLTKLVWQSKDKSRNINLQISHTYTDAHSNINTYAYRKNVTATLLSLGF